MCQPLGIIALSDEQQVLLYMYICVCVCVYICVYICIYICVLQLQTTSTNITQNCKTIRGNDYLQVLVFLLTNCYECLQ